MHPHQLSVRAATALAFGAIVLASSYASADETTKKPRVAILMPSSEAPPPRVTTRMANVGPQLGLRTGYALGTGGVYSGLDLNDGSHGALPVILDLGWRAIPELYVGVYGQFGYVFPRENNVSCPTGFDCAVQDWRMGLQVDYHFLPRLSWDPYVGIGAGYEILHNSVTGSTPVRLPSGVATGNVDASTIDRGWEYGALTLGADFRIDRQFGVGPFVTGTMGQYNVHTGNQTVSVGSNQVANGPVSPVEHTWHELFIAGLRGTFNP